MTYHRVVLAVVTFVAVLSIGIVGGTSIVDIDGDGVPAFEELLDGTDSLAGDTDGDGLDDGTEIDEHGTDPLVEDTDGDGVTDAEELAEQETNPTDPDTDDDGLEDGAELDEHGTDPTAHDSDGDGLDDGKELQEYGTAPSESDTDADGIGDGLEVTRPDLFPDADPLRMDIYVEVDEMKGTELPRDEARKIVRKFADAPTENPDGSNGISLHFEYDDVVPSESRTDWDGSFSDYRQEYRDMGWKGHHYMFIVQDVRSGGNDVNGTAMVGRMLVEHWDTADVTGSIAMHELGHSLGLGPYAGADSYQYSYEEYPSVMNYNAPVDAYGYSTGGASANDFDDWGYIQTNLYTPSVVVLENDG